MNLLDTEINVITKNGKPQTIEVGGIEIHNVTAFQYNADGSIDITLYGNVKFVEEVHHPATNKELFDKAANKFLREFSKCNTG